MTTTAHTSTYQWLVMHDEPDSEGWIGEFNDTNTLSFDEYMELMRAAQQPGAVITIDPEWLQPETTPTPDPSTVDSLDISDAAVWELFETTRDTGVLLRVTPIGFAHGSQMKVIVDAVHDLVDVHALPGSPERRLLDFFGRGTPTEPDPLNALWQRPNAELDGFGDTAHRYNEHIVTEYERHGEIAHARCTELGMESDWCIDCLFPHEMLYAVSARGHWTAQWTPEGYTRIAGRFEKAFGLPLHPDDPMPITDAAAQGWRGSRICQE